MIFLAGFPGYGIFFFFGHWIDGKDFVPGDCRDAGKFFLLMLRTCRPWLTFACRIVEYATRDQAQNAVNSLSNQNLMGRLVYVREVRLVPTLARLTFSAHLSSHRTAKQSPASAAVVKVVKVAPVVQVVCVVASKEATCAAALVVAATITWAVVTAAPA
jgi:hypothetical protein